MLAIKQETRAKQETVTGREGFIRNTSTVTIRAREQKKRRKQERIKLFVFF